MADRYYAGDAETVVKKLNSDPVRGLSHQSARVRYGRTLRSEERDFYFVPRRSRALVLAPCVCDFSLWLLLLTTGALAFFDQTRLALASFLLLVLNLSFSVIALCLSARLSERLTEGFRPKVRVIREGRLFLTDCRYVVRGDVVLLTRGDVVPFDARILSGDGLLVSVCVGRNESGELAFVTRKKDSALRYDGRRVVPPEEQGNMVTAGSLVLSGSARVIVTETGTYTYIGALTGGIPIESGAEEDRFTARILHTFRKWSLVLSILLIPLTAIAYLLGGGRDLPIAFLTVLSLLSAVLPGGLVAAETLVSSTRTYRFLRNKSAPSEILYRSTSVPKALSAVDVLALFDEAMLTDGRFCVSCVFAEGMLLSERSLRDPACRSLLERALLMRKKETEALTLTLDPSGSEMRSERTGNALTAYAAYAEVDAEEIGIRYAVGAYRAPTRERRIALLEYSEAVSGAVRSGVLCRSEDEALILRATHIRVKDEVLLLSETQRKRVLSEYALCRDRGRAVDCYAEQITSGELVFLGFISYAEPVLKGTREAVSTLSSLGVRTVLFSDEEADAEYDRAKEAGIVSSSAEVARASCFHSEGRAITEGLGSYSLYLGFSEEEIVSLLRAYEQSGMHVGCVSLRDEEVSACVDGSLRIACSDASLLESKKRGREAFELPIVGASCGGESAALRKLESELLVSRASGNGGGLTALARAISFGRRLMRAERRFSRFLLAQLAFTCGWFLPAMVSSRDLYSAFSLVLSGVIASVLCGLLVLLVSSEDEGAGGDSARIELRGERELRRSRLRLALLCVLSGTLLSLLPALLVLLTDISPAIAGSLRLLSLLIFHAAVAFGVAVNHLSRRKKRKG